ncbi:hypothetical protein NHQ30_000607 [Ciborinia camelliae]|nr:hypothetical protein NHQ30_000607 [Ciborinia camelliae]
MRFSSSVVVTSCVAFATANPIIAILPIIPTGLVSIYTSVIPVLSITPTALIPTSTPVIPSYTTLNNYCQNAGPNAYVGVQYADGVITSYNYGDCYPYTLNGSPALAAVFCKSVICSNCAGENCTNANLELLVPRSVALVNPWGVVTTILGKGAICEKSLLSLPVFQISPSSTTKL